MSIPASVPSNRTTHPRAPAASESKRAVFANNNHRDNGGLRNSRTQLIERVAIPLFFGAVGGVIGGAMYVQINLAGRISSIDDRLSFFELQALGGKPFMETGTALAIAALIGVVGLALFICNPKINERQAAN